MARGFQRDGFVPSQSEYPSLPYETVQPDSPEANKIASALKPELFALGLVFADMFVDDAYKNRIGDWGLITSTEGYSFPQEYKPVNINTESPQAFQVLGKAMSTTLDSSLNKTVLSLQAREGDPYLISAFKRLEALTFFLNEITPLRRTEPGVRAFLVDGIGTNCDMMSGLLGVIANLDPSLTPDDFSIIAKNSYPFVLRLASQHAEILTAVIAHLKKFPWGNFAPFREEFFQITGFADNRSLDYSPRGAEVVADRTETMNKLMDSTENISPTVGCLAQGNLSGSGSPIKKQWEWNTEIGVKIISERQKG